VRAETSFELIDQIPDHCIAVSESGLRSHDDLLRLRDAGFDAFLIGEHLMLAPDPVSRLLVFSVLRHKVSRYDSHQNLRHHQSRRRQAATDAGANSLGFNFYERAFAVSLPPMLRKFAPSFLRKSKPWVSS